jgi:HPr kinase/phosphorylase
MDQNDHRDRACRLRRPSRGERVMTAGGGSDGPVEGAEANVHASAVAFASRAGPRGILVLGASGAGKSGLALRLMALGAALVADDRVVLRRDAGGRLMVAAPAPLRGLVEARGVGLLRVPAEGPVPVSLAVDLDTAPMERLPSRRKIVLLGCDIDLIRGRDVPNLDAILTVLAQREAAMT